jgi:hypothetical protein
MASSTTPSAVFIVLATHNGAAYVAEQIESICQQSLADWTLLVRDDGSTDRTPHLVHEMAAADPRIHVVEEGGARLGAAQNFGRLLQRAYDLKAEYVFFADQDDVWLPDKLHKQLTRMRDGEAGVRGRLPHLVYSDLTVVDPHRQVVHPSFLRASRQNYTTEEPWKTLLGRSFVLGCACLINRPLMEFALPLPEAAVMHDWWVTLCAAHIGGISLLAEPMVLYRRHGGNASGPSGFWAGLNPLRHSWKKRWQAGTANFRQSLAQAQALHERLQQRQPGVAPERWPLLDRCCQVFERPAPGLRGIYDLCRLGVPQIDLPRRLLYYFCLMLFGGHRLPLEPNAATPPRSHPGRLGGAETGDSSPQASGGGSG